MNGTKDSYAGRGEGRGKGGPAQKDGGAAKCICPECGFETEHDRDKPCAEISCPKCGSPMAGKPNAVGSFAGHNKTISPALWHVALLGKAMPAVKTLDDITHLGSNGEGWIDVFDTGTWNGRKITPEIIKSIVDNFNLLKKLPDVNYRPALVVGHEEKDIAGSGTPAVGWIDRLKIEGSKMLAYVKDIPEKIRTAIRDRRYRTVSIQISKLAYTDGADGAAGSYKFSDEKETLIIEKRRIDMTDVTISREKYDELTGKAAKFADLEEKSSRTDKEKAELAEKLAESEKAAKESADKLAEAEKKVEKFEEDAKKHAEEEAEKLVDSRVDELVKEGKVLPAQKDSFKAHVAGIENDEDWKKYSESLPVVFDVEPKAGQDSTGEPQKRDDQFTVDEKGKPVVKVGKKTMKDYKDNKIAQELGVTPEQYAESLKTLDEADSVVIVD